MKNRSANNMLHNNGQRKESWGTPKSISSYVLYELFALVLCFLSDRQSWINFEAGKVNPCAFSSAMRISWLRQQNAFYKSVNKAPSTLLLSTAVLLFSSTAKRRCWAL